MRFRLVLIMGGSSFIYAASVQWKTAFGIAYFDFTSSGVDGRFHLSCQGVGSVVSLTGGASCRSHICLLRCQPPSRPDIDGTSQTIFVGFCVVRASWNPQNRHALFLFRTLSPEMRVWRPFNMLVMDRARRCSSAITYGHRRHRSECHTTAASIR